MSMGDFVSLSKEPWIFMGGKKFQGLVCGWVFTNMKLNGTVIICHMGSQQYQIT